MSAANHQVQILIVDDHPIVCQGLAVLLEAEPDLRICGTTGSATEGLRQVKELQPDLVLVDISLEQGHGIELVKQLRAHDEDLPMLVCSMHDEALYAERALRAGAKGYINKQEVPQKILEAVRQVLQGKIFLSPEMTERLLHRVTGQNSLNQVAVESLSDRELAVFELIGQGESTRSIADHLNLSIKTVETHRDHIKTKLKLTSGIELICHAVRWILEKR